MSGKDFQNQIYWFFVLSNSREDKPPGKYNEKKLNNFFFLNIFEDIRELPREVKDLGAKIQERRKTQQSKPNIWCLRFPFKGIYCFDISS